MKTIKDKIREIIIRREQVNGFQPYGIPSRAHDMDDAAWEKRDRQIFFDGWEDGRAMMRIDLQKLLEEI